MCIALRTACGKIQLFVVVPYLPIPAHVGLYLYHRERVRRRVVQYELGQLFLTRHTAAIESVNPLRAASFNVKQSAIEKRTFTRLYFAVRAVCESVQKYILRIGGFADIRQHKRACVFDYYGSGRNIFDFGIRAYGVCAVVFYEVRRDLQFAVRLNYCKFRFGFRVRNVLQSFPAHG